MLPITLSTLLARFANGLSTGKHTLTNHVRSMASALHSLLTQSRTSHSESSSRAKSMSVKEVEVPGDRPIYSGSLHRHQRSYPAVPQYRSMLDVDTPSLRPIDIAKEVSMEDWVAEKLIQASQKHTTAGSDWADILCFYTAANGAPTAPTRASPSPVTNGKAVSSQDVPQSVSSTDPKIAAQQASDMRNIVRRKLTGYVGFANLPNQWHRKSVRKGFNFNVMVVGKLVSGHIKSILLTIFRRIWPWKVYPSQHTF